MIIGVDAGALCVSDERLKVGVYRVIVNLLKELGSVDTKNTYILYSFDPIDRGVMEQFGPSMENRVIWPVKGWFTVRLPLELHMRPPDVFLGVSQALPRSPSKTIGFIYDAGFIHHPKAYPKSLVKLKKQTETLVKRADHILTISKTVQTDIQKLYGIAKDNISVAYPGIDSRFTPRGDKIHQARPYFLFVGALKPGKNIPALIRAFATFLTQTKKPYDLLLVGGDYWMDREIKKTIQMFGLEHQVKILGYMSDVELPQYYRGAVALVSPSLYEGFCIPLVEAMACGCPVIGSTAGAMPEIICDAGLTVDPNDDKDIAHAMRLIASNKHIRASYVKKGIIRSRIFSWSTFGKTVLSVINEIARNP